MATTYKQFTSDDVASTRTLLHESIPLTGTIVSGTYGDANINGANISNNIIIDFLSHGTRYGIKIANPNAFVENVGCVVSQNIISGDYSHEEISTPPTTVQEDNSIIS